MKTPRHLPRPAPKAAPKRGSMLLVGFVLVGFVLAGCSPAPSPIAPIETPSVDVPGGLSEQTLWSLAPDPDSVGEALADDDPDVQAVRKAVALYTDIIDRRSWESIRDSAEAENAFYSAKAIESLGNDYAHDVEALFEANMLRLEPIAVAWYRSSLSADRLSAVATIGSTFQFVEASVEYREQVAIELGRPYVELRRIYLAKVDGVWLIDRVERQPLQEVASSQP